MSKAGERMASSKARHQAVLDLVDLCRESKVTRMVITHDGLMIAQKTLDPRGKNQVDTMSVTKAIAGLAVGVFLDENNIPASSGFSIAGVEHTGITIEHVLFHSSGLHLREDDQVTQLYRAQDFSDLIRRAEIRFQPGSRSEYSNLAVNLLSLLIQEKTGGTLSDYARDHLFAPLGISGQFWESDDVGHSFVMAGLHLKIDDMARIGSLLLNKGVFKGKQVLPVRFVDELWNPSNFLIDDSIGGRVSWRNLWAQTYYEPPDVDPITDLPRTAPDFISANGYGGQYIIAMRRSGLLLVTQRDMDLADPAPTLGGDIFLRTLRRLDYAFSAESSTGLPARRDGLWTAEDF